MLGVLLATAIAVNTPVLGVALPIGVPLIEAAKNAVKLTLPIIVASPSTHKLPLVEIPPVTCRAPVALLVVDAILLMFTELLLLLGAPTTKLPLMPAPPRTCSAPLLMLVLVVRALEKPLPVIVRAPTLI